MSATYNVQDLYAELSEQCKKYACDLLDQCRSSEEVIAVLNKSKSSSTSSSSCESSDDEDCEDEQQRELDDEIADLEDAFDSDREDADPDKVDDAGGDVQDEEIDNETDRLTLDRFKLALKYEQKQVRAWSCTSAVNSTVILLLLELLRIRIRRTSPE
jgi:hypothetical protein